MDIQPITDNVWFYDIFFVNANVQTGLFFSSHFHINTVCDLRPMLIDVYLV